MVGSRDVDLKAEFEVMMEECDNNNVLIVDDTETNIDLLMAALSDDFEVSVALNGEEALQHLNEYSADLVLLDIMMPGIDGYEVFERMKANPRLSGIPVVFLTALNHIENEAKGLNLGAVDYITKPYNPSLVKARVRNHIELANSRRHLQQQRSQIAEDYEALQDLETLRDNLVHMIVHDMKSPLMGICGNLELAEECLGETVDDTARQMLSNSLKTTRGLNEMISSLLDVSRLEAGEMPLTLSDCDLRMLVSEACERLGGMTIDRQVELRLGDQPLPVQCDRNLIERLVLNLVGNALKYAPADRPVFVKAYPEETWLTVEIHDEGPGIPAEYQDRIFEKFGQVEAHKEGKKFSTGLGLAFCRLAVVAHGGSLSLKSAPGEGSIFYVRLPLSGQAMPIRRDARRSRSFDEVQGRSVDGIRMVVIDPSEVWVDSLKSYIESRTDWSVKTFQHPSRALEFLKSTTVNVILIDEQLAEASDHFMKRVNDIPRLSSFSMATLTAMARESESQVNSKGTESLVPSFRKDIPLHHILVDLQKLVHKTN